MKPFFLKNNNFYLEMDPYQNPLNQHTIKCSDKMKLSQLWEYEDKIIKHSVSTGYLTKNYHGWTPNRSSIILQIENDYDIDFQPLLWEYKDNVFTTEIDGYEYILGIDSANNVILQRNTNDFIPDLFHSQWKKINYF